MFEEVILTLQQEGYEAYVCGGAVRDMLLGRTPKDIDIATSAIPDVVERLFPRTVTVGKQFGVVKVVTLNGDMVDVATFRSDGLYSDGRRPATVRFASAKEDAMRRDFTINGLFLDPVTGKVVDFVGGVHDIENRVIRTIGNPADRFSEDLLRPLRAIRFATVLGFEIHPDTFQAVRDFAPEILKVSAERIKDEILKVLMSPNRVRGLRLLDESGLLEVILPEVARLKAVAQPLEFHPEGDVFTHTLKVLENLPDEVSPTLAMAALLHDVGKPDTMVITDRIRFNDHDRVGAEIARAVMTRLKVDADFRDTVMALVRDHMVVAKFPEMRESRRRLLASMSYFNDLVKLHRADALGSNGDLSTYNFIADWVQHVPSQLPPRIITGDDLIQIGLKPGPGFKKILNTVYEAQLEGRITTKAEALRMVLDYECI